MRRLGAGGCRIDHRTPAVVTAEQRARIDRVPTDAGRFAPSPTGDLHLGNLRTALVAWLFARSTSSRFVVRMEDLDRMTSSREHEARQLRDLAALGLDWDGEVVRQSERFDRYHAALDELERAGRTYRCWCTRREIRDAAAAPHGPGGEGLYPGSCRDLDARSFAERAEAGRPFAVRFRRVVDELAFDDELLGPQRWPVDDVVLSRNDGVPAYHLAVVVDDAAQGVELVVRGDDLAPATASQLHLAAVLGLPLPRHAHVAMVLNDRGERLSKRDGAVTLSDLSAQGVTAPRVLSFLARSLRLIGHDDTVDTARDLVASFRPEKLPAEPLAAGRVGPSRL